MSYEEVLMRFHLETPEEREARWRRVDEKIAKIRADGQKRFDARMNEFLETRERNINSVKDPVIREAMREFKPSKEFDPN